MIGKVRCACEQNVEFVTVWLFFKILITHPGVFQKPCCGATFMQLFIE